MNKESQEIIEQFKKNFINNNFENIIIYGTGKKTIDVLENIPKDSVKGLMDAKKTGEKLLGYKVLSYDEVSSLKKPVIVILARPSVIKIIYRRIKDFCKNNNIDIYDVYGNLQTDLVYDNMEHECFYLSEKELLHKIDSAKVVSFDVFDTLITRNVMYPRDIFNLMDEMLKDLDFKFSYERKKAEDKLDIKEPTINDIYEELQENLNLSDEKRNQLMNLEIDMEIRYTLKRDKVCEILEYAVKSGKRVFLISDMYLLQKHIGKILENLNISGYEKLIVSSEYGMGKNDGLFEKVSDEFGLSREGWLHIGDNPVSDIAASKKCGIESFQLYSPITMYENSIYSTIFDKDFSLEENIILSKFIVNAYNNPFGDYEKNGKLIINSDEKLVEFFVAPIVFKYMSWLIQNIKLDNIDFVIFPSRDGYLLKRIYDRYCKKYNLPDSVYLYTSRRSAMIASIETKQDIKEVLKFTSDVSLSETIEKRFGLKINNIEKLEDLTDYLYLKILDVCDNERKSYEKYLHENINDKYKKIAFVDFVAMGSIQYALEKILKKRFHGFYFMKRNPNGIFVEDFFCKSLYPVKYDYNNTYKLYQYYYFLENLMTSYEPTVKNFISDKPNLYHEKRSDKEINVLRESHNAIEKYFEDIEKLILGKVKCKSDLFIYDNLLGLFSEDYSTINKSVLLEIVNIDEFMGRIVEEINR